MNTKQHIHCFLYSIMLYKNFIASDMLPTLSIKPTFTASLPSTILPMSLQVIATIKNVIICINLIDEANKKQIQIDVVKLSNILHVPVIAVSARQKQGINNLLTEIDLMCQQSTKKLGKIQYDKAIENIISQLSKHIETKNINKEIVALKLLNNDIDFINNLALNNEITTENLNKLNSEVQKSKDTLISEYSNSISLQDIISSQFTKISEEISKKCIHKNNQNNKKYKHLDDFLTNKWTGLPSIILLLCMVFWITIAGANAPSEFLSTNLFKIQDILAQDDGNASVDQLLLPVLAVHVDPYHLCQTTFACASVE